MKRQSALNRSTSSKVFHGTRHQEEFDRQTEKRTIIFEVYNVESLHAPNRVPIVGQLLDAVEVDHVAAHANAFAVRVVAGAGERSDRVEQESTHSGPSTVRREAQSRGPRCEELAAQR